jgi:hypothetical protein
MANQELETINRAVGYCQALWYHNRYPKLSECKFRALEMYGIVDYIGIGIFFELIETVIPSNSVH